MSRDDFLWIGEQYEAAYGAKSRAKQGAACVLCGDSAAPHCHLAGDARDWAWPCADRCECVRAHREEMLEEARAA